MKRWIRRWLGIDEILDGCTALRFENRGQYEAVARQLKHIEIMYGAQASGLARVIAKIDPMFGKSEFDPNRIAETKKLEDEIIAKLYAEHRAANHHRGE